MGIGQIFSDIGAQLSLPFGSGVLRGGALVAGVEVSVLTNESHSLSAQATKVTIESGAQVTDHVILQPEQVSVAFEVKNIGDGPQQAKDVFETFKKMLEAREQMQLITEHYVYDEMVITGVSPIHNAPFKGKLQCTVNLQRVKTVKLEVAGKEEKKVGGSVKKTAPTEKKSGQVEGGMGNQSVVASSWDSLVKK
jgi:hypothetical protein